MRSEDVVRKGSLVIIALGTFGTMGAPHLVAQGIPETFTNLRILPGAITRPELVAIMREYTSAVGGRCSTCHMVSDALDQPIDDFASDAKGTKQRARVMMEMVNRINTSTLTSLPDRREPNIDVTCDTCHGGIARPEPIEDLVASVLGEEGIEAAIDRYRQLRSTYLGTRAYDFSFGPLNRLAERLRGTRSADALRLLEINAEYNPTSLPTLILLGNLHEQSGDTQSALGVYRGVLALDPALPLYDFYAGQARNRIAAIGPD